MQEKSKLSLGGGTHSGFTIIKSHTTPIIWVSELRFTRDHRKIFISFDSSCSHFPSSRLTVESSPKSQATKQHSSVTLCGKNTIVFIFCNNKIFQPWSVSTIVRKASEEHGLNYYFDKDLCLVSISNIHSISCAGSISNKAPLGLQHANTTGAAASPKSLHLGRNKRAEAPSDNTVCPPYRPVTNGDLQNAMDISQSSPEHALYSALWGA